MFTDITGIPLIPGNRGCHCPGNGTTPDENGNTIECCCEECDYMLECFSEYDIVSKNTEARCFLPQTGKKHL